MNHDTLELVFIALVALALVSQAGIMLMLFLGIRKGVESMKEEVDEIKSSIMPILRTVGPMVESTRDALARMTPKVESTVNDVAEMARVARGQAASVEASMEQIIARANKQAGRVDGMVSSALDAVDKAGEFVVKAVGKPVRQLSGMLAGIRAMFDSLGSNQSSANPSSANHGYSEHDVPDDKDMFV